MKELTVLAEIEYSYTIANFTIFEAGIWRVCLYATGPVLPFMKDTFNRTPIQCNNVVIDQIEYYQCDTLEELRDYASKHKDEGCWHNGGNMIYIRFPFYNPPNIFYPRNYGVLMGFTDGRPLLWKDRIYRPGLETAPKIAQSADTFTYDRMKFNTADATIENSSGRFDDASHLFGNEFNFFVGTAPEEEPAFEELAQYYIENVSVSLGKASFKLSDKRERLSGKIPFEQYTIDKYPDIDDKYIGKDMQEVYGRCFGVPGVCLDGEKAFANNIIGTSSHQYRFRFSSQISRVDRIQVKVSPGEYPTNAQISEKMKQADGWFTVYESGSWKPGIGTGGDVAKQYLDKGEILLRWDLAKQGGKTDNRVNEVRIDGVFIIPDGYNKGAKPSKATPRHILMDIMRKYSGEPFYETHYDWNEITEELKGLDNFEMGIMFDKAVPVFEAIEKLQSGSINGFQFQVYKNKYTARLDNPKRSKHHVIRHFEILNLHEVEVDWNASLYGTYANIEYAYNYSEKAYQNVINRDSRNTILELHRVEKEWKADTLLASEADAEAKAKLFLDDFSEMRPLIKNIQLTGEKWLGLDKKYAPLRVYDVADIDFRIPGEEVDKYPHHIIRLIEQAGEEKIVSMGDTDEYVAMINEEKETLGRRDFMKSLLCQVMRVDTDTHSGITTIDVRVIGKSNVWE